MGNGTMYCAQFITNVNVVYNGITFIQIYLLLLVCVPVTVPYYSVILHICDIIIIIIFSVTFTWGVKFLCRMAFLGYNLHIILFSLININTTKITIPKTIRSLFFPVCFFFYQYNIIKSRMLRFPNLGCGLATFYHFRQCTLHTPNLIVRDVTEV
jgi:hypothetical protein